MAERLGIYSPEEVRAAQDLVREALRAVRTIRLYEVDHPNLAEVQVNLRKRWDAATMGGPLSLRLTDRRVMLDEETVLEGGSAADVLPTVLYEHGIVGLVLKRGLEPGEARRLLDVLALEPDPGTDYATLLWEADLKHVQVLVDSDEFDLDETPQTPAEFAEKLARIGDDRDPPVGEDYEEEREQLASGAMGTDAADPEGFEPDRFGITDVERQYLERLLKSQNYVDTVRHAARVVHAMARETLTPESAQVIETALGALLRAIVAAGDLPGALEIARRADAMRASEHPLAARAAELTLDMLRDPEHLWAFLLALDMHEQLDTLALSELLALLGPEAAPKVAEWMLAARHPDAVSRALRVFGEDATRQLVPLFNGTQGEERQRATAALLAQGTPDALLALAPEFDRLPEENRLELLNLVARNNEPGLREVVYRGLRDPAERIRRAAVGAVRRADAARLAALLPAYLEDNALADRPPRDVEDFFEMLARVGDKEIAETLAEQCRSKGLLQSFKKPTPLQELCARALRRMRDRDARAVADELRRTAPRPIREILNDNLGDIL